MNEQQNQSSSTSASLLERAQSGDERSWQQLMSFCRPQLVAICRKAGVSNHDIDDLVQDTLTSVVRNIGTFRKVQPKDSFRAWLTTIVKNKIIDHFRRTKRDPMPTGGSDAQQALHQLKDINWDDESITQTIDGEGVITQVLGFLRTHFEERSCQVFIQIVIKGRSASDVASDLGMTKAAVYQANHRTLKRVRLEFADLLS